jgi:hypothetical protein
VKVPQGAEKERDDLARAQAHLLDGSRAKLLERDLELRSRVRNTVAPLYAYALFMAFDEMDRQILVGRDKWIFLRARAEPRVPTELMAKRSATILLALERRLADLGVRLVAIPVPRKEYLCAQQLPPGFDARLNLEPTVVEELHQRGVRFVDLLQAYAGDPELLYHHLRESLERARPTARRRGGRQVDRAVQTPAPTLGTAQIGPSGLRRHRQPGRSGRRRARTRDRARERRQQRRDGAFPAAQEGRHSRQADARRSHRAGRTSFSYGGRFHQLVEHFTGQPIFNAAEGGQDPGWSLRELMLGRRGDKRPQMILCEIPFHCLDVPAPLPAAHELFTRFPPAGRARCCPTNGCGRRACRAIDPSHSRTRAS